MEKFEAIVVGGGVMGCASAAALARRGVKVLLCEADQLGSLNGSSHGKSRIIRLAYGATDYIALCRASYAAWRTLEDEVGAILFYTTGGIDLGNPDIPSWRNAREAMRAADVRFEILDQAEMREAFPQFNLPEGMFALHQPDAGVLHADQCIAALAKAARRNGAVIREGAKVSAIARGGEGIIVQAGGISIGADRLVLAAGAQINALLAMIGDALPLTVSEEQVAYFRPRDTSAFVAGRFPLFITHFADGRLGSGFPLIRDPGIKLMLEHKSVTTPSSRRLDALRDHAVRLLPGLSGQVLGSALCRYTLTPDEDFVLDLWPDDPRIVIASPCSGHGFKFGALFGGALAALALGETPKINLSRFRLDRFAKSAMVRA